MKTKWAFALLLAGKQLASASEGIGDETNAVRLTPAFLNSLTEILRTNHPGLQALQARTRASSHATGAIKTWDDPMLKIGGVVATDRGPNLEEDGDIIYGLDQRLPLFGRSAAERRLAGRGNEVSAGPPGAP